MIWTGTPREVTTWDGESEELAAHREAHDHMVERLRRLFE